MTINAQPLSPRRDRAPQSTPEPLRHRERHGGPDRPTADLVAATPSTVDAYEVLDHRTRASAIPLAEAPAGRYLSVEHDEEIHLIPLVRPIIHLGRGLLADVRIEDPHVSRRHAIIAQRGDGVRILDDRSANGTHVNGRRVDVAYLGDGDVIRLGHAVLRFVEVAPPWRRPLVKIRTGPYTARVSR